MHLTQRTVKTGPSSYINTACDDHDAVYDVY